MQNKNYMTVSGYKNLQEELFNLVTKERPNLVNTVNWAASNGDRSENGDYIYGKKRLREVDKKIRFLTIRIENATVVDHTLHIGSNKIFFGAEVTFIRDTSGTEEVITIVGQDEIDVRRNFVSWTSPIAKALINKSLGDEIKFITPSGNCLIEILEIKYDWQYLIV